MIIQSLLFAISLSMDAFAVSITNGLTMKKVTRKKAILIGCSFGIFQAGMPTLGYGVGGFFSEVIQQYDHYIALIFLGLIGSKMLYDGISELRNKEDRTGEEKKPLSAVGLVIQSFATSIDALVVGITFIAMGMNWNDVIITVLIIGAFTSLLSVIGVYIGKKFGDILGSKAEIFGGLILIGIGLNIFIKHSLAS